jgi:hypothetical protein
VFLRKYLAPGKAQCSYRGIASQAAQKKTTIRIRASLQ